MAFEEPETESLRHLDAELARAFGGTRAPSRLRAAVMTRIYMPPPTRLPDFLDAIG